MKGFRKLYIGHQHFIANCTKANIGPTKTFNLYAEIVGGSDKVDDVARKQYGVFGNAMVFDATYQMNSLEWRHLPFDFKEDIHIGLVHEVMNHDNIESAEALQCSKFLGTLVQIGFSDDAFHNEQPQQVAKLRCLSGYSPEANFEQLTFLRDENEFKDESFVT
nr:protein FAR1-RELATED SEQUENCE 5-like [Ipomoea batatas]